ncbi:lytic transglycosylase [Pseudoalteromonas luteoviolacea]|uniref:Lytic transglycosylase n=1 Tax=Pseudoalteromonas luteoviolacea TaxID=43657 RepID=A0A1C0TKX2_9GAMM|nr:LysM peptidoglycan-binding domain-containing protein [Pseudoalteromonas luteoviolacea]MBQ4812684.1 LysM peptidoglycan-binding domain-containing protein [Pseudoalteromonas luteoviolacea]OCQ19218.1 lytic transglycosylase [Pseudoalteromonas luteoviolacea]
MLKRLMLISTVLTLTACQSTSTLEDVHDIPSEISVYETTQSSQDIASPQNAQSQHIAPTSPEDAEDVWQRIRQQIRFAPSEHPRVKKRIEWYLQHPNYMHTISERAEPLLYYIVTEIEKRNLPIELALMPLIETDFDMQAYSHKHASGLWQLTPLIAKHYGLKINPWYDGRQDLIDSTHAALDFLTYLHRRFDGNWYHAIAAYNTGEGRVLRAIDKNRKAGKSTDFFALQLPRQTRHYVPKLLAATQLLKQQLMNFPAITNAPALSIITLPNATILDNSPEWSMLAQLNTGYARFPALLGGPNRLIIPTSKAGDWQQYAQTLPTMPDNQWQSYTVRRGDSLSVIAENYGLSVSQLKSFNQLRTDRIRIGDTLILPILADQQYTYTVKSGDSLWRIARQFNVSVNKLKQWNQLSNATLQIGKRLTIFLAAP